MPQYDWKCIKCDHRFSVVCLMSQYKELKKCPECKEKSIIRDYDEYGLATKGEPTTLGALAEANTKKMSPGELERAKEQERRKRKPPPTRAQLDQHKENRKIANMTPTQKQRYIMTGEGL